MKNNHKMFILIEGALGLLVLILAIVMLRGNTSRNLDKVSVIVQDSDDNQWDAFKYGLRMAAEDQEIEMFVVGTEGVMSVEEQESLIEQEIDNGADAVIVQPVPGAETEAMLKRIENGVPVMLAGSTASLEKEALEIWTARGLGSYPKRRSRKLRSISERDLKASWRIPVP